MHFPSPRAFPDHASSCPSVCLEVTNNFSTADPQVSNQFFQQYFLSIMQDVFFVLTDTDHKSGFKLQSMVLARLFQLVQTGAIGVPLFDPSTVPDPNMSNSLFLQEYTATLLKNAFPHLQPYAQLSIPPSDELLTDYRFLT
jgi:exportin-1